MFDVIVVGAGPIGLNTAIKVSEEGKSVLIIEAENFLGGQLTRLYPEKEIVDIKGIPSIKAKDYIASLVSKVNNQDKIEVKLSEKVNEIKDHIVVTNKGQYEAKYIVITIGLGTTTPRPMGLEGEKECSNILYSLQSLETLKNKEVLVLGGGDSALDWTKEISNISDHVTIIHRRKEFRGDFNTIKDIKNVIVKTPFIPVKIIKNANKLEALVIRNVETNDEETLCADYVFVNYGNIPMVNTFNFASINNGLAVNNDFKVNDFTFAIGDIARYESKKNRIEPGLEELSHILPLIK